MKTAKSFLFIAGEASGDTLGAELVRALSEAAGGERWSFYGAGGPKMQAAGVELAFDLTTHAVVGIVEVLKNYGKFKGFFDQLLKLAEARRPDYVVLIDYPGFNLRFAKALKERCRRPGSDWNPKLIYYVSPQIWAWHESRVHQITRDVDLLLSIFPFEKDWYGQRKPGFRVEFVGHPLVERFAGAERVATNGGKNLLLLPGSRERELRKHLPVMIEAVAMLQKEDPTVRVRMVLPSAKLRELAGGLPGIEVQIGGLAEALQEARAAIASSGTVTMECAWFRVPTVVIYKTSASTYFLGRRFIRVKHLAMPNLLAGQEVYPELIQSEANGRNIYLAAKELLNNEERRSVIKSQLERVIESLGAPGASRRAAAAILSL